MIKNLTFLGLATFMVFFGIGKVNAASNTGWQNGPSLTPGSTVSTGVYNLTCSHTGIKAKDVTVLLTNIVALPTRYVSSNDRTMRQDIMEYDVYPNEDDFIATYKWSFNGRMLDKVVRSNFETGNIDSADDNTAEIYLRYQLTKVTGDSSTSTGKFFDYRINVA